MGYVLELQEGEPVDVAFELDSREPWNCLVDVGDSPFAADVDLRILRSAQAFMATAGVAIQPTRLVEMRFDAQRTQLRATFSAGGCLGNRECRMRTQTVVSQFDLQHDLVEWVRYCPVQHARGSAQRGYKSIDCKVSEAMILEYNRNSGTARKQRARGVA
jgi:hypothetical protein